MSKKRNNILSYKEKYFALENYFENGLSVQDLSDTLGIGESTVRDWLKIIDCNFDNIDRLKRKERLIPINPNNIASIPEEIKNEILKLVKTHPEMGPLKVKQYFYRHHQKLLSEKKIYFFLKEKGFVKTRQEQKRDLVHDRRFEYQKALEAVQLDLLTLTLSGGAQIYLVTFLDDFSRYILSSRFVEVKTMKEVIKLFRKTLKIYGLMDIILTDRGSEFVSWQSFTEFEELLCNLDIELIASGPETPQNQGKLERWHRTLREECVGKSGGFDSRAQAELELNRFIAYYNYERPHQGIGGLVPADRFYGVAEELEKELEIYRNGGRKNECIYVSCNINGKKLVISGPRNGELNIYQGQED